MKIYLFRHGETEWNKDRRLQGQSDVPLNAFGRELAEETAGALEREGVVFDRAFSSPLSRALETARILTAGRNISLETDRRLMEMNFGAYEGSAFDPPKKDPAHPLHDFLCRPEAYVPAAGAESFGEVMARARNFLEEKILPLEGSCGTVLVAAHGAFNRCLLGTVRNMPLEDFWKVGMPNCAVSILSMEAGKFTVLEESRIYYDKPVNVRP